MLGRGGVANLEKNARSEAKKFERGFRRQACFVQCLSMRKRASPRRTIRFAREVEPSATAG